MRYRIFLEENGKKKVLFYQPKAYKIGRQKIKLPMSKVLKLRQEGYSYNQIAKILEIEDNIKVSGQTIWRRLREIKKDIEEKEGHE